MVYFGYSNNPANRSLDGFGFLIPRKEERKILGTIWSSTIFSNRAPEGGTALTTLVGGSRQPEIALLPEAELIETVKNELKDILGIKKNPDLVFTKVWPKAIPQYDLGHQQFLDEIIKLEKDVIINKIKKARIHDDRNFFETGISDIVIDRKKFDQSLANKALKSGIFKSIPL